MKEKRTAGNLFVKNTNVAADFLISLVVIVIALVFFFQAGKLPTKDLGIGPGDYPRVVCCILLFLGAFQLIKCIAVVGGIPVIDFADVDKKGTLRFFIMAAVTYAFYKLLKIVGFPILAPLYLFFAICFFGYKSKWKAAIISVVFTTVIYVLFTKVFLVLLPAGFLG